jgi:hypothetical protein
MILTLNKGSMTIGLEVAINRKSEGNYLSSLIILFSKIDILFSSFIFSNLIFSFKKYIAPQIFIKNLHCIWTWH